MATSFGSKKAIGVESKDRAAAALPASEAGFLKKPVVGQLAAKARNPRRPLDPLPEVFDDDL